jgi:hypothetical protein
MEKGLIKPKMPVASISPNLQIVPRPPRKVENCGDDKAFIACPVLKIRNETPIPSDEP